MRLIEQHKSFQAADLTAHELPELDFAGTILAQRPIEGSSHVETDTGAISGWDKRTGVQIDLCIGTQAASGIQAAHDNHIWPGIEPVVETAIVVEIVEKYYGRVRRINFPHSNACERASYRL
jgi:hypothetical protein